MLIDGSLADMAAIAVGIASALLRPVKRWSDGRKPLFQRESAIVDVLNGVTIVPFLLMIGSVFSTAILAELIKSAKVTLAIGGMVGLIFVLGELTKEN